jgi:hypothetical protein
MDEPSMMAVALMNDAESRAHRSDDWERDIARLQRQSDDYERIQAIKAPAMHVIQFFRRHALALRAARA